ncbi:MAG: ectonucleotide pyrophosphatase/phosphodiesterase [Thermoanaerobaculia bacterium]|nr:ectonucleotide pyrophosphatase/phosphodiesterase [Thermoanaerobaculia bacterium]
MAIRDRTRGAALLTLLVGLSCTPAGEGRTVVVALFDGFAPAMVEAYETPNLDRMRAEGAWSHHLVPVFPTVSLPNHTSFTTGCLPASHGIVSNRFLDPARGFYDHSGDADWRVGCESLPEAAERQGVVSASIWFPGDRSRERGPLATHVQADIPFDQRPDDLETAAIAAAYLQRTGADRPRLVQVYLKGPDDAAHYNGLDSPETRAAVERSDAAIGVLLAAAEAAAGDVTVIVGTDHGMAPIDGIVNIPHILRREGISAGYASSGASSYLYLTDPADRERAVAAFSSLPDLDAYPVDALPAYARVGMSARVGDVLVVARPPRVIEDPEVFPKEMTEGIDPAVDWPAIVASTRLRASHGYDPALPEMHGILYAWGSGIAAGREVAEVSIVDIHPTVAHLLGIAPGSPVDGEVADGLLAPGPD